MISTLSSFLTLAEKKSPISRSKTLILCSVCIFLENDITSWLSLIRYAEEPFVYGTYPSLLHDRLYIQLSEKSRGAKAIIRTTSGREVMRTDLQPNDELVAPVEVSHLAPGVYKLEVVSPAGTYKQTIMKGA